MTKKIAFASQKGGTGKTTMATALAVGLSKAGHSVALIDLDPQANAANWDNRRPDDLDGPAVASIGVGQLTAKIAQIEGKADYILIDTAGRAKDEATAAMEIADLVLVPTDLQAFEIETLQSVKRMLRIAGDPPAFVVINRTHPSMKDPVGKARELGIESFGIPLAPVSMTLRAAYADTAATGKTPADLATASPAAEETRALCEFVENATSGKLHKSTKKARA